VNCRKKKRESGEVSLASWSAGEPQWEGLRREKKTSKEVPRIWRSRGGKSPGTAHDQPKKGARSKGDLFDDFFRRGFLRKLGFGAAPRELAGEEATEGGAISCSIDGKMSTPAKRKNRGGGEWDGPSKQKGRQQKAARKGLSYPVGVNTGSPRKNGH